MDTWLSHGTLEMSGKETAFRQRGSLRASPPQDLLVSYRHRSAYRLDGQPARDTQRLWGLGHGDCPDPLPERLPTDDISQRHDDLVAWGGFFTPHYGHFLTESVARLWAHLPDGPLEGIPVVFATSGREEFISDWERAFGVKVVKLPHNRIVRFTRMSVPEPAWRMNGWVAAEMRDIHLYARDRLAVSDAPHARVVWMSRSRVEVDRRVRDEALCQWLLGDRVRVIHPEELSLARQVAQIEACDGLVGAAGSAFHTLLMTRRTPRCLYLSPSRVASSFVAQDRLLEASSRFVHVLTNDRMEPDAQDQHPYRLLIPETLRILDSTLLTGLLDDPRLARLAYPERWWSTMTSRRPTESEFEILVARVLLDPNRIDARMDLGARFEEKGVLDCALEQFSAVADLAEGYAYAPLRAARILSRLDQREEAARFARRALQADPGSDEAKSYIEAAQEAA